MRALLQKLTPPLQWLHSASFLALVCLLPPALNAEALDVGDKAPPIKVDSWLNGDGANPAEADGKTTYIVEFWATWCPPCRVSIPHLSDIQKEFRDQDVILISITDEPKEKVSPFAKKMKMDYLVGMDTERDSHYQYMAGISGIPYAFIVDSSGLVVWHGHPMSGMKEVLISVLDGTHDPKKTAKVQKLEEGLQKYLGKGDFEGALESIGLLIETSPARMQYREMQIGLLTHTEQHLKLSEAYHGILTNFAKDEQALNTLAWMTATSPLEARDLDISLQAAKKSLILSKEENPAILDTVARVYYALGLIDQAIEFEQKAISLADEADEAAFKQTLKFYKSVSELRSKEKTEE